MATLPTSWTSRRSRALEPLSQTTQAAGTAASDGADDDVRPRGVRRTGAPERRGAEDAVPLPPGRDRGLLERPHATRRRELRLRAPGRRPARRKRDQREQQPAVRSRVGRLRKPLRGASRRRRLLDGRGQAPTAGRAARVAAGVLVL